MCPAPRIGELAVTETESRPRNRALVASFLFTDLVGYSKGTAADQYAAKAALSEILTRNLAALRKDDYRIKDTGDGALDRVPVQPRTCALHGAGDRRRTFSGSPSVRDSLEQPAHGSAHRRGEGSDRSRGRDPISSATESTRRKRIMDFAAPGQITASRAYFEAVSWLDSAYAALFQHLGASDDKHGRAHELYAVSRARPSWKSSGWISPRARSSETAEADTRVRFADERQRNVPRRQGATGPRERADGSSSSERAVAIGVLASIYLGDARRSNRSRNGTTRGHARRARRRPATAATGAHRQRLPLRRRQSLRPAPSVSLAPFAEIRSGRVDPARGQRKAQPRVPLRGRHPPHLRTRSFRAPTPGGRSSGRRPRPVRRRPATRSARCQHIMEKATLGESLSQDEKRELASSCR
mgnify:CR=1 FL=1